MSQSIALDNIKKMPREQVEEVKVIYNILADKIETVTPFFVENILKNDKTGTKIDWLTDEIAQERFNSDEYLNRNLLREFGF